MRNATVAVYTILVALTVLARILAWPVALAFSFWLFLNYALGEELAKPPHSNPWLLTWIPSTCCVTNDCCWEIAERDLQPLTNDEWLVRATGQIKKRTGWSPDGKFYRCACDYDNANKRWDRHIGANTRCIFVPMRSAQGVN